MFILDAILEIEQLRCFEVNNDASGPPVNEMIPHFRKVQAAKRPLLVRGSFTPDELRLMLDALDPRGLLLLIMIESLEEIDVAKAIVGM
jgi:hypothetical protein